MKLMSTEPAEAKTAVEDVTRLRLETFLPYRLNVLAQLVSEGLARIYADRFGIGIAEWRTIATLGEAVANAMTARDIGARSRMHKTKVSRAVASLERRGMVGRKANIDDRREAFLSLTAEGHAVYAAIVPLARAYAGSLTEGLPPDDHAALNRAIAHCMERSGIVRQEPPRIDQ